MENQDVKISEMHIVDKALTEKEQIIKEESDIWKRTVVLIVLIVLSVLIAYYFFRKNKKIKKDRLRMKEEIEQMKEELNQYSQNSSDEKILNPELDLLLNSNKLTDRQKDLLILLADGLSNKEIAEKLFISENTVKYHTKNIYNTLDIKDRKDFFKKLRNN
ncbi:MAG: hypothetical protein BGO86_02370 [Chryseobacterium sp. 36-9]|nr:MAG: hypothetical protein BGO86_02370 [Chryseobacterium sp. 36-9]